MSEYTIQAGDSLWNIVKNNYTGLSDTEIMEKINCVAAQNNIQNANQIMIGQTIQLPDIADEDEFIETNFEDTSIEDIKGEEEISETNKELANKDAKQKTDNINNKSQKVRIEEIQANRPNPILDENGNVIAKSEFIESDKEGSLTGTTIIVNAGHGGQSSLDAPFDPGAVEQNSGYEEWAINQAYGEELTQKILAEGGNVIFIQGTADLAANAIIEAAQKYGNEDNSNLKFISLHCDITEEINTTANGIGYYFNATDDSINFSNQLAKSAENEGLVVKNNSVLHTQVCRVAEECGMESTLIEMGFMNNQDDLSSLINNNEFQNKFLNSVVKSLV